MPLPWKGPALGMAPKKASLSLSAQVTAPFQAAVSKSAKDNLISSALSTFPAGVLLAWGDGCSAGHAGRTALVEEYHEGPSFSQLQAKREWFITCSFSPQGEKKIKILKFIYYLN